MLYQKNIGYLSRWPTWVLYNYSFRADLGKLDWSQLSPCQILPPYKLTLGAPPVTQENTAKGTAHSQTKNSHRLGNLAENARTLPSPQLPNALCLSAPYQTEPRSAITLTLGTAYADLALSAPSRRRCQGPHPMNRCRRQGSHPQQGADRYHN